LTNHPPQEARDRFLNPEILVAPRDLNSDISPRTERAIFWAMSLHPDERPQSIQQLKQALLGDWNPAQQPRRALPTPGLIDLLSSPVERILIWVAVGLLFVSLIATFVW
jgi:hypothetical protein